MSNNLIITLNVRGTTIKTLKDTLTAIPYFWFVNEQSTDISQPIFVDYDPEKVMLILNFIKNNKITICEKDIPHLDFFSVDYEGRCPKIYNYKCKGFCELPGSHYFETTDKLYVYCDSHRCKHSDNEGNECLNNINKYNSQYCAYHGCNHCGKLLNEDDFGDTCGCGKC